MSKLIYVDRLKQDILDLPNCYNGFSEAYDKACIIGVIDEQPTIEPRKKGRWIPQDHNRKNGMITTTVYYCPTCSVCGKTGGYDMNYCPSCGADMRGETE